MGGIGGSLWHGIKGFKNSPKVDTKKKKKKNIYLI